MASGRSSLAFPTALALGKDPVAHNMCFVDEATQRALDAVSGVKSDGTCTYAIGGQYHALGKYFSRGVFLYALTGESEREPLRFQRGRRLLTGHHRGCLELRRDRKGVGEFDGQNVLIYFRCKWFLYSRANCAQRGYRQVQVCIGDSLDSLGDCQWVSFAGVPLDADAYFAHVDRTDVMTLVALLPIALSSNQGEPAQGGIYIAESASGVEFGPPVLLKGTDIFDRRTADMPLHFAGGTLSKGKVLILPLRMNVRARMPPDVPGRERLSWWEFPWPDEMRQPTDAEVATASDTRKKLRLRADMARGLVEVPNEEEPQPQLAQQQLLPFTAVVSEVAPHVDGADEEAAECREWLQTVQASWAKRGQGLRSAWIVTFADFEAWRLENSEALAQGNYTFELNVEVTDDVLRFQAQHWRLPLTKRSMPLSERIRKGG